MWSSTTKHASLQIRVMVSVHKTFHFSYLRIHEEVPHQGHGLLHRLLLWETEGVLLLLQGLGSSHHEAGNLVIQAVQGLHS